MTGWENVKDRFEKGLNLDQFHVLDINNDGLDDVIFNGFYGGEGEAIKFFVQNGSGYTVSKAFAGRIKRIEKSDLTGFLNFEIHDYPCCAGIVNHIIILAAVQNGSSINFNITSDIAYMYDVTNPNKSIDPIPFITVNPEYKLRSQPVIDNEYDNLPDGYLFDGNTCAVYPKGSTGYAISNETDSTGRVWWLVIMENNLPPIKTNLSSGRNDSNGYHTVGWMSSKYVKRLN